VIRWQIGDPGIAIANGQEDLINIRDLQIIGGNMLVEVLNLKLFAIGVGIRSRLGKIGSL
jgi:hypothetical protein